MMPTFQVTAHAAAPVEEVWKLLNDPCRFPQWWSGVGSVESTGPDGYTMWPTGYPDFPMPQKLHSDRVDSRVSISCLVSDLQFVWQLREDGDGTVIDVHVTIPAAEAHRSANQEQVISASLDRLVRLAAGSVMG